MWVSFQDWEYVTKFDLSEKQMSGDSLSLKLDKVGTYGTIYLNDIKLGEVNNLYRTYYFALKQLGVPE